MRFSTYTPLIVPYVSLNSKCFVNILELKFINLSKVYRFNSMLQYYTYSYSKPVDRSLGMKY